MSFLLRMLRCRKANPCPAPVREDKSFREHYRIEGCLVTLTLAHRVYDLEQSIKAGFELYDFQDLFQLCCAVFLDFSTL